MESSLQDEQRLFEPTVMFFGLTNSPATFQTMMDATFRNEIATGDVVIYMDDILTLQLEVLTASQTGPPCPTKATGQ